MKKLNKVLLLTIFLSPLGFGREVNTEVREEEHKTPIMATIDDVYSHSSNAIAISYIPQVNSDKLISFGFGGAYSGGKVGSVAVGLSGQDKTKLFTYRIGSGLSTDLKWNIGAGVSFNFKNIDEKVVSENDLDDVRKENKMLVSKLEDYEKEIETLKATVNQLVITSYERKLLGNVQKYLKSYDLMGYEISKYELTPSQMVRIDAIFEGVGKDNKITIVGFTDTRGTEKSNLDLGLERGKAVAEYLKGMGYTNIIVKSGGYNTVMEKVDKNKSMQSMNRRVEITYEMPIR